MGGEGRGRKREEKRSKEWKIPKLCYKEWSSLYSLLC